MARIDLRSAGWPLLAALAIAVTVMVGRAQEASRQMVGLVEVPTLFNRFTANGEPIPIERPVYLLTAPVPDSAIAATIRTPNQLNAEEYGYEEMGAVAYARQGGWTLVKTSDGIAGWLTPQDAGTYHSLESLLEEHHELADLTDAWDGTIRPNPDARGRIRVPLDPERTVIGFLEPTVEDTTVLPVFEQADPGSRVVAQAAVANPGRALRTTHAIPYEIVVLERRPGWYRVAPAEQIPGEIEPAWLAESPVWRFHPLTDDEGRAFGRRAWGPDNPDVRVIGTRRIEGALWVEIEVLDHSLCVGKTPIVRQRGWIPAHAPSGELNIWYASRGC